MINIKKILRNLVLDNNNIYTHDFVNILQKEEINYRKKIIEVDNEIFDFCWSVQVFDLIPNIKEAIKVTKRVMKSKSVFYCITQYRTPFIKMIYFIFKKKYHSKGLIKDNITINKFSKKDIKIFNKIFEGECLIEFSKFLFHPSLKIYSGSEKSFFGNIYSYLTGKNYFLSLFARQISFKIIKN